MKRLMVLVTFLGVSVNAQTLTLVDGYAFVPVMVNGKGPFRMLLDTGASSCALSPEAAKQASLEYDHRVVVATAAGERAVPAGDARVRVGNMEAFGTEVLAQPIESIRKLDPKADGVLGQSFLSRFPYLIDYKGKRLLVGPDAEAQADTVGLALTAEQVSGRMVVPVGLAEGGKSWRLALDSGSQRLLVECGHGCPRLADRSGDGRILTNSGERSVARGFLKRVEVGGLAIARAETLLIARAPQSGREDGLLPARLFSAVYVDASRNQVRLAR